MSKELVKKLLNTKNEDEFIDILMSQDIEYDIYRELWDDEVIKHFMKLFNLSIEEFEKQFLTSPPIDDFDDEEYN